MTYTTLQSGALEKPLADWLIDSDSAQREVHSLAGDSFGFNMLAAADMDDPFPFGSMIVLRTGRVTASVNAINATLPVSGATAFSGGQIVFIGYRRKTLRIGSPSMEALDFKFDSAWGYLFEETTFKKAFVTYNGAASVVAYRSQIVLGLSLNTLYGAGDTVTGSAGTCLMSIRQQIIEIVQYLIAITTAAYGAPQVAFDDLTNAVDTTNYDLLKATLADLKAANATCLIPDYLPGWEPGTNQTSATANMDKVLRAPLDAVTQVSCAEALRKQLRWLGLGNPVAWLDYSTAVISSAGVMTSPPTLRIGTRNNLPSVSLPWPPAIPNAANQGIIASTRIERRDDLIPSAVCCEFRIVGQVLPEVIYDIATNIAGVLTEGIGHAGLLQSPAQLYAGSDPATTNLGGTTIGKLTAASNATRSQNFSIDMEGNQTIAATISCATVAAGDPTGETSGGAEYNFWTALFPELLSTSGLKFFDATNLPGYAVDETGAAISLVTYPYRLLDGNVQPWMEPTAGTPGVTKQGTINANFSYTEVATDNTNSVNTKSVTSHPKSHPITLTNLPGGTYTQTLAGELVPYGLAGFVFAMETVPHYEGTITVQEQEVTDVVPIGSLLNLSGGRAEWVAMNATVQSVTYNYGRGTTEITFGPPGQLGLKDFVELVRNNRGPRWIYMIGSNLVNSAGAGLTLGGNVPRHGSSPGNPINSLEIIHTDLADAQTNNAAYGSGANPVYPGVTNDAKGTTQYPGGADDGSTAAPGAPTVHLAAGSGGDYDSHAHLNGTGQLTLTRVATPNYVASLNIGDVPDDFDPAASGPIKLREVTDCVTIDGTPTTVYRQVLASAYYTSPLGNT